MQWHCDCIFFPRVKNDWASSLVEKIEINMSFEYGLDAIFLNDDRRFMVQSTNFAIMCLRSELFFTGDVNVLIQLVVTI